MRLYRGNSMVKCVKPLFFVRVKAGVIHPGKNMGFADAENMLEEHIWNV